MLFVVSFRIFFFFFSTVSAPYCVWITGSGVRELYEADSGVIIRVFAIYQIMLGWKNIQVLL